MREQFSLEAGTIIASRYEVVEPLGSGAMGAVLKVIDRTLDNEVIALKLLYPHHVHDDVTFGRFRNEVLVARQLTHPNIVRIHDFGRAENGYCFISMEYVRGHSLRWRIYTRDQDLLALQEMVYLLREICKGLSHAHGKGIVHRDLKPDNVLLSDQGELKLTDYGLARTLNVSKGFTETGNAVGTPAYMSPEQISGEPVDARSDIYSLGLIAYEMAVGIRAFSADNWYDLANKHLLSPLPRFATEHGGIPQWYEEFAQVCAAKKKEDRFQDAAAALEVLSKHLAEEEPTQDLVEQAPRKRKPRVLSVYQAESSKKQSLVRSKILTGILFVVFAAVSTLGLLRLNPTIHRTSIIQILQMEKAFGSSLPLFHRIVASNVYFDEKQFVEFVRFGNGEAVELLLEAGMNANLLDEDGKYMLHLALERGHVEVALGLLKHGANVHARDKQERTPLMYAVSLGNIRLVDAILARTTSTNAVDTNGRTALMYAAASGNVSMVQSILQKGAAVNWRDKSGRTALFSAIGAKEAGVVQALIEAKADVNALDQEGVSPLMYASQLGDLGVVKALVYQGADSFKTDHQGRGVGFYATEHSDVARFLKQHKTMSDKMMPERGNASTVVTQKTVTEPTVPSATLSDNEEPEQRVRLTRLRLKGKPEGLYETHTLRRLKEVRVQVRNVGDVVARDVQVVATLPGGKQVTLVGARDVARGESAYYEVKLDEVVLVTGEITARVTCENCW